MKPNSVAVVLAAALALALPRPSTAYDSPQVSSLAGLRAASRVPVAVRFRAGFPQSVRLDVPAPGKDARSRAEAFLAAYAPVYGQDHPDVAVKVARTESARGGGEIVRLFQTYRGLRVFGAELVVRLRNDPLGVPRIESTSGALLVPAQMDRVGRPALDLDTTPAIAVEKAATAARKALRRPRATLRGTPELMIYDPGILGGEPSARLVWRLTLAARGEVREVLVDANSGALAFEHPLIASSDGFEDFDLDLEHAHGGNMADTNCFNPTTIDEEIGDEDGIDPDFVGDVDAATAWWGARNTYAVYHDLFDRHSYDDDDGELEVYVHAAYSPPQGNAGGTSSCGIEFTDGFTSIDITAHEFTHMVVDETSDFVSANQSGALNESFADIIGVVVDPDDWTNGEDRTGGFGVVRSLTDPTNGLCGPPATPVLCGDPDRMSAFNPDPFDNGGVHTNAGINNKAFFLMAEGGAFNGRNVPPMGLERMAHLAYELLTGLGKSATFATARDAAVSAATSFASQGLFGFDAQAVCSVREAYRAVELGQGDQDCDGVEDSFEDDDQDGILTDGDGSSVFGDGPCPNGVTADCDDNCPAVANPTQSDSDGDLDGDACDTDDDDDGWPDSIDACLGIPGSTPDTDGDGAPDCTDLDDDNDGIPDDGDFSGDAGDAPCASGDTTSCDDNCAGDPNPDQFDGNGDGFGDACDPDADGDGLYVSDDNCPFVANVDQLDGDGDELGDACDGCPEVVDETPAYGPGIPELGIEPAPLEPDSDGDGTPDACDPLAFARVGVLEGGRPFVPANALRPDGSSRAIQLTTLQKVKGTARLPVSACDLDGASLLGSEERMEVALTGLPASVDAWIEDGRGLVEARFGADPTGAPRRGLRFRPRCDESYSLVLAQRTASRGAIRFDIVAQKVVPTGPNPWTASRGRFGVVPPYPESATER
jgi:Zn-dependent metalloprotease